MSHYTLIVIYASWKEGKTHVSKNIHEINPSLCGRNLGFNFGIESVTGNEGDKDKIFTADEIRNRKDICKKCLKCLH